MKKIKTKTYLFLISFIFTACIICGFLGVCICYQSTVKVAYGKEKAAVSFDGGTVRILDFEFDVGNK